MNTAFRPKKSLGQNFLINPRIQKRIVEICQLNSTDIVLEIGPGKGALTKLIADRVQHVYAVEKDGLLADHLKNEFKDSNITIFNSDILKFSLDKLKTPLKVIGNLPYNISTPIIEKLIDERKCIREFYIMLQKEYADRLIAKPRSKKYGSLSCFVQYYGDWQLLFRINKGSFRPMPKIESAFLKGVFYEKQPHLATNEAFLFKLIRKAFNQRRKTLENSLKELIEKNDLIKAADKLNLDLKARAETINLEDYVGLSNFLGGKYS